MKKFFIVVVLLVCILGLAACDTIDFSTLFKDNNSAADTIDITFDDMLDWSENYVLNTACNVEIALPSNPARTDYVFGGWYFDKDTWSDKLTSTYLITNPIYWDRTVYAKWTKIEQDDVLDVTYHVVFDTTMQTTDVQAGKTVNVTLNGSTVTAQDTNYISSVKSPTLEGYTFEGWYLYKNLSYNSASILTAVNWMTKITFPYVPVKDLTLYAKWTKNSIDVDLTNYTLSFGAGAEDVTGEAPADIVARRYSSEFMPDCTYVRDGYDFVGWYDGQTIYTAGTSYTVSKDVAFIAKWRLRTAAQTYALSFASGTTEIIVGETPATESYEAYEQVILPANPYTRSGYRFLGWEDSATATVYAEGATYITSAKASTLVAKWQLISYQIEYCNMEGAANFEGNPAAYSVTTATFELGEPTKTGYSFDGWFMDSAFATPADTTVALGSTGALTLYAKWSKIELTMYVNASGTYTISGYTSNSSEITIPSAIDGIAVTAIDDNAFQNCTTLTKITIPATVTSIGRDILKGCYNLVAIITPFVGETATPAIARNSVIGYFFGEVALGQAGAVKQQYVESPATAYAIPSTLKEITITSALSLGQAAFQNLTNLKTVTLSSELTSLPKYAFSGCTSLSTVNMGNKVLTINANAFADCKSLKSFNLPSSVTSIADGVFVNSGLVSLEIPQTVTTIGGGILKGTSLTSLTVPFIGKSQIKTETLGEGVLGYLFGEASNGTEQLLSATAAAVYAIPDTLVEVNVTNAIQLQYGAFSNCKYVKTVTINNGITAIDAYAFSGASALQTMVLPNSLATIGDYAFANATSIGEVALPLSLRTMGEGAYKGCTALKDASAVTTLLTEIEAYAFQGCTALESTSFLGSIKHLGAYAFQGCTALRNFYISNAMLTIGDYAFAGSKSFRSSTTASGDAVSVPSSVATLGAHAFESCTSMMTLTLVSGSLASIGDYAFANCTGLGLNELGTLQRYTLTIPRYVTSIGNYAFYNCSNVSRLEFNINVSSLETIGDYAFANCSRIGYAFSGDSALDELEFGSALNVIGAHAFENCVALRKIIFENGLETIGDYAFGGCYQLGLNIYGAVNTGYTLTIPDTVTTIGDYAFAGTEGKEIKLYTIIINHTSALTTIGAGAFAYCNELTAFFIPNTVTSIGTGAFRGTDAINEFSVGTSNAKYETVDGNLVTLDKVFIKYADGKLETSFALTDDMTAIAEYAFGKDPTMLTISVPLTVVSINRGAFYGSTASLDFSNATISTVAPYTFEGYAGESITLPSSIITIQDYAFAGSALKELDIPDSATTLGAYIIEGTAVEAVTIPATVTTIADAAFAGCAGLKSITVSDPNGTSSFSDTDGVLFQKTSGGVILLQYPAGKTTEGGIYTVPSETLKIAGNAFDGANGITELIIGNNVTEFELSALRGLNALQALTVPFIGQSSASDSVLGAMFGVSDDETGANQNGVIYAVPTTLTKIIVTDITELSAYAFASTSLTDITLGLSLQTIGAYAFDNVSANVNFVSSETESNNIFDIVTNAFSGLTSNKLTLPDSVTNLYARAFEDSNVKEVVMAGVTNIGNGAFLNSGIQTLVIPDDADYIGSDILKGCASLKNLTVPFIGSAESDINLVSYFFGQETASFEGGVSQTDFYNTTYYSDIPELDSFNVTIAKEIAYGAFQNCDFGTITIGVDGKGTGVETIGSYAFEGCTALVVLNTTALTKIDANVFSGYKYNGSSLLIPASVVAIENNAFYRASIKNVTFASKADGSYGVRYIEDYAFAYCSTLYSLVGTMELPDSVEKIGDFAFYYCGMSSVNIGAAVIDIGNAAFGSCFNLTAITVDEANSEFQTSSGALYSKDSTRLIQYPAKSTSTEITLISNLIEIGDYAFYGHTGLSKIYVSAKVQSIGAYAFAGTEAAPMSLSSVIFGGNELKEINEYAFAFCTGLTSITLPSSVEFIGKGAFSGSSTLNMSLLSVNLSGNNLNEIDDNAFAYCSLLTSFVLPTSVTRIGSGALMGCSSLESLSLPFIGEYADSTADTGILGYVFGETADSIANTTLQHYDADNSGYYFIPETLKRLTVTAATSLSYGALYGCNMLDTLTLNSGLQTIGDYAMYACTSLTTIDIPDNVTSIGAYAFSGTGYRMMSLESVNISATSKLTTIGEGAFYACGVLETLYIPIGVSAISDYMLYNSVGLSNITLADNTRLTAIGDYAFYGSAITEVTVPSIFRTLGASAFENSDISSFTIRKTSLESYMLNSIGDRAFYNCLSLSNMYIPNTVLSDGLGDMIFYGCTGLKNVDFGEGGNVLSLGEYAFYGCSALESISLADSLLSIGDYCFFGCESLSYLNVPSSVKTIGAYAFAGKDNRAMALEYVSFASDSELTKIGNFAFNLCYNLVGFDVPDGLTEIAARAFYNCTGLQYVNIERSSELTSIGDFAFAGCSGLVMIYIPANVTSIGTGAFRNTKLTLIDVDRANTSYSSPDGNLYTADGKTFIKFASGITSEYCALADTVTTIGSYAFADAVYLKEVWFGGNVITIGEYAFSNASSLTTMIIPQSVETIATYAFTRATALESVTFEGNSRLTTLSSYAFFGCKSLQSITLPIGIDKIENSTFYGCTSLESVSFLAELTSIGSSAFYGCSKLTLTAIPSSLATIGDYAFYGCSSLVAVNLGESVVSIGEAAFNDCSALSAINVAEGNSVYASSNGVLYSSTYTVLYIYPAGKTDVTYTINSRTTTIAASAFLSAENLRSMVIPSRISRIGSKAFYGATSLVLYCVQAEPLTTWAQDWNSSDCPVYYANTVYTQSSYQFIIDADGNAVITRYLGSETTLVIPATLESTTTDVQIPVIGLGAGALLNNDALLSVLIPANVTYMAARAIEADDSLTVYCAANAAGEGWERGWNSDSRPVYYGIASVSTNNTESFQYVIVNNSNVTITRYVGAETDVVIPNMIGGIYVTAIGAYAFSNSAVVSVTLPSNLASIGVYAFSGCSALTTVVFNKELKTIGAYAFNNCVSLMNADINIDGGELTTLNWCAFAGCTSLIEVVLPDTLATIGGHIFKYCTGLSEIKVEGTVPIGWNVSWNLSGYEADGSPLYFTVIQNYQA